MKENKNTTNSTTSEERMNTIQAYQGKENVVDSISCKGSDKCLFYNTFIHTIQSATKNKI